MIDYAGDVILGVDSDGERVSIQEGESCNVVATPQDMDGSAIAKASLLTLTASLFLESSGASINSRKGQDVLDANGGAVSAAGVLTLRLQPADNVIVGSPAVDAYEQHILRIGWTWNDGVLTPRTGIQDIRLYVQQLRTVT
jgi:hypothetical protein